MEKHQTIEEGGSTEELLPRHNAKQENLFETKLKQILNKVEETDACKIKFRSGLPLARIKRIMKIDKDIRISAETAVIFAKACELFIIELSCKSFVNSVLYKRRTIQKCDLHHTISRTEYFDFLIDQMDEKCRSALLNYAKTFYSKNLNHDFLLRNLKFPEFSGLEGNNYLDRELQTKPTNADQEKEPHIFSGFLKHYEKFEAKGK